MPALTKYHLHLYSCFCNIKPKICLFSGGITVNDKSRVRLEEAVTANYKVLSCHFPIQTEENDDKPQNI